MGPEVAYQRSNRLVKRKRTGTGSRKEEPGVGEKDMLPDRHVKRLPMLFAGCSRVGGGSPWLLARPASRMTFLSSVCLFTGRCHEGSSS